MANSESKLFQEEILSRLTEEALADVDQTALIAQTDMLAWAESLGAANPLPLPQ